MTGQLTILSISDPLYLNRLKALISSVSQNYPQVKFYCHLVNTEQSVAESLQHLYPNLECNFDYQEFNSEEDKKAYCANIRADVIYQLMQKPETSSLLYLDADSIVRKDLSDLLDTINNHDLVVLKREEAEEKYLKFAAGVIGIKNSSITQKFIAQWATLVKEQLYEWYSDQLCLYYAYEQFQSQLNTFDLPQRFIDWEFLSTSSIWVGKGPRKDENKIYVLEEEYYLTAAVAGIDTNQGIRNLLEQQILVLEADKLVLREEKQEQKNNNNKLVNKNKNLIQKKEDLQLKLSQEQEKFNLNNKELNHRIANLKQEIKNLKSEIKNLKSENKNLSSEINKMHRELMNIKNSKFWKMRKQWIKFKSYLNFIE